MATKPRSIFEDVTETQKPVAATGMIDAKSRGGRGGIRIWLMSLFALVVLIIAVGGMTRLTDSGLSITEWAPISGSVPPLNAADWDAEFEAYKQIPEYIEQNNGMSLSEFKAIYWWEWGHRQLGRVIGLVWFFGYVAFAISFKVPTGWHRRLLLIGALIGVQGAIGWWMVHSGLQDGMLDVASYRLATHLGLAFVILGVIAWFIFLLGRREADLMQARRAGELRLFSMSTGLMYFALLQILLGALVAGIDAGRAFPTWPSMGGGFFPPDPFQITPIWRNFFEDAGLVQFVHRMSGYLLFLFGIIVWRLAHRSPNGHTKFAFNVVLALMTLQMIIGIITVLYSAPVQIAILHQFMAVLLWVAILRGRYLARYPLAQSVRG